MSDGYPTISLEHRLVPLGPRWLVTIDDLRGGEWGVESFDAALELVRVKWGEIERMRAADEAAHATKER